ncbi:MAG TPA: hypothetical protein VF638_00780 [Sphingomonas sp.]|jgi:hypothetical protein
MAKAARKTRPAPKPAIAGMDATPERLAKSEHTIIDAQRLLGERMAKARRCRPPIDVLFEVGSLTEDEHIALSYYGDQCRMARRSPLKDSLNQERGSGGLGLPAAVVSALLAEARIDRDLGQLRDIAHAVAVDEVSLPQWCIQKHGGRERYNGAGKFVAIVPVGEVKAMRMALMELKWAAGRIVK